MSSSGTELHQFTATEMVVYALINYSGLFLTVGIGWLVWWTGAWILDATPPLEFAVFGAAVSVAGICLILAGIVGTVHKLLVEGESASCE